MSVQDGRAGAFDRGGCPSWCIADHETDQQLEDRWHESSIVEVPIVESEDRFTNHGWQLEEVAVTLAIALEQHLTSTEPTVVFGPGDDRLRNYRLTIESTRRFMRVLEQLLTAHES